MPTAQNKLDAMLNHFRQKIKASALLCALALSACSAMSSSPSAGKEKPVTYVEQPNGYYMAAGLGAEDISKRVLNLVLGIHGRQDVSPEIIAHYTGLKAGPALFGHDTYGFIAKLTDMWYAILAIVPSENTDQKPNRLEFEFNAGAHDDADMSPVCVPLSFFGTPLTAAGFTAEWYRSVSDHPDAPYDWEFSRGTVMAVISRRGKKTRWDTQTCVHSMTIYSNISKGN
jgi:hypothetical protein